MRLEIEREFPVSRKEAYDYLHTPTTWRFWLANIDEVYDADVARWDTPGERIRFAYRLLGRRIEGELELEEITPAEYLKIRTEAPAVGTVTQHWYYEDAGEDAFRLRVVYETDEPTSLFGRVIDRTLVPRTLEHDLEATMANLETIFALGVPD